MKRSAAIIRDNRAEYMRIKTRGAPRNGELLLHGIAWCARCRHKMFVRYKGGGQYVCNRLRSNEGLPTCQEMRAARIDQAGHGRLPGRRWRRPELDALSKARRAQHQVDLGALRTRPSANSEKKAICRRSGRTPVQPRRSRQSSRRGRTRASLGSGVDRGVPGRPKKRFCPPGLFPPGRSDPG